MLTASFQCSSLLFRRMHLSQRYTNLWRGGSRIISSPQSVAVFRTYAAVGDGQPQTQSDLDYCRDLVRHGDSRQYMCNLLMPAEYRDVAWVVSAFNVESASMRSEDQVRQLRSGWWQSALADAFEGKPLDTPFFRSLASVSAAFQLSPGPFLTIGKARVRFCLFSLSFNLSEFYFSLLFYIISTVRSIFLSKLTVSLLLID
jgi:hypothetical protein